MNQLIVIAEEQERKLIEKYLPEDIHVLVTGVGALNIMRSLCNIPLDTEIFNIGYAGSANFEVGTLVSVTEAKLNHPNVKYDEPQLLLQPLPFAIKDATPLTKAICYSGVDFVLQSNYKDCIFDMEIAFICGMGFKNVHSIKYVSDNLSLHQYREVGNGVN